MSSFFDVETGGVLVLEKQGTIIHEELFPLLNLTCWGGMKLLRVKRRKDKLRNTSIDTYSVFPVHKTNW